MACCGQQRQQMRTQAVPVRQASPAAEPAAAAQFPVQEQGIVFQYIGKTAMTAVSPLSGRQYRFGYPGAIVRVDARDSASLAAIPNLRQI
jgi:hypothetical protein